MLMLSRCDESCNCCNQSRHSFHNCGHCKRKHIVYISTLQTSEFTMHTTTMHNATGYVTSFPLLPHQFSFQKYCHHTISMSVRYQGVSCTLTDMHGSVFWCAWLSKNMPQRRTKAHSCCWCTKTRNLATADCTQEVAEKGDALQCPDSRFQ